MTPQTLGDDYPGGPHSLGYEAQGLVIRFRGLGLDFVYKGVEECSTLTPKGAIYIGGSE